MWINGARVFRVGFGRRVFYSHHAFTLGDFMLSTAMLAAVFYILGIYITDSFGLSAVIFLCIMLFGAAILKRGFKIFLCLAAFAVLIGALRYGSCVSDPLLRQFSDKYITAEGIIFSQPVSADGKYANRYTLKLENMSYVGFSYKTRGCKILLNTDETFKFGDKVKVSGFLSELSGIDNEFEYDFSAYYKSKGIYARITAREAQKIGNAFLFTPEFLSGKIKSYIHSAISASFSGNRAAFLKAVLLNDKSGFSDDYKEMLLRTGIYRSLYSPFTHISYIFLAVGIFCKDRKKREYIAIILLLFYALWNSTSPTAIKACALSIVLIFRKELFGFADKLEVLSLIVLILLIADPMLCFNSGFIVSVASSVLVYFSYTPIYTKIFSALSKHGFRRRKFCGICTVWIIFTVGTLPICARAYNGISVYSSLFSVLTAPIPIISAVLSAPAIIFYGIFGKPAFAFAANIPAGIIDFMARTADKLPFSFLRLSTPSLPEILAFYIVWWLFLRGISGKLNTEKSKLLAVISSALIVSGFFVPNALCINFVNVGQGDAAVLHTPRGETVVIDGGGAPSYQDNYNVGEQVFVPYLVSHGFTDIDVAILSHYHKDHAEGIVAVAKNCNIDTLVMPDTDPENSFRTELEALSKKRGFKIEYLSAGDEIRFKSGLSIKFSAPDAWHLESLDPNDTSLVAHVRYGEFDALFTGDSGDDSFDNYPRDVELLKVAHHGSSTSSGEEYIAHINPQYAVISVGANNTYGLPDRTVLKRLSACGAQILRTGKLGDIRIRAKKDGSITYNTLRG